MGNRPVAHLLLSESLPFWIRLRVPGLLFPLILRPPLGRADSDIMKKQPMIEVESMFITEDE